MRNYLARNSVLLCGSWNRQGLSRLVGLERSIGISVGYASMALAVVLPLTLVVRRLSWKSAHLLIGCFAAFLAAITFRIIDRNQNSYFSMGPHFLWHLFGGISVWCLMLLTMKINDQEQKKEDRHRAERI